MSTDNGDLDAQVARILEMTPEEIHEHGRTVPLDELPALIRAIAAQEERPRLMACLLMKLHGPEAVTVYDEAVFVNIDSPPKDEKVIPST
jgi:hypothetical protein